MAKKIMLPVLDDRLMLIASMVREGAVPLDVGTDHAYVAIYLAKKGVAEKIIAADIKKGPLMQADKNISLFEVSDRIETRLSNGFEKIGQGEVECAIIAGMGGETIAEILENEKGCRYFVLQMQTGHSHLRDYLIKNGYIICDEAVCREDRKMYTALLAMRGESRQFTDAEKEIGPVLIEKRPPLFYDYVRYRLYEIDTILKNMKDSTSGRKEYILYLKNEYDKLLKEEQNG